MRRLLRASPQRFTISADYIVYTARCPPLVKISIASHINKKMVRIGSS
jgi:hypothetical protein